MIYIMVMVCVVSIVSAVYLILTMDEWWVQVTNGLISTMEYLSKGRRKRRENIVLKRFWNDWMYSYIDVYVIDGYDNPNLPNMETFEWEENFLM